MSILLKRLFFLFTLVVLYSCSTVEADFTGSRYPYKTLNVDPKDKLPKVSINTNNQTIAGETMISVQMKITQNQVLEYSGTVGIEYIEYSSQLFPKKQFAFETRNESGQRVNVSLLGFPEDGDWILYGPYSDKSLMRDVIMYDLSREIGRYASRVEFVEVFVNNSYNGVYVLLEKMKRAVNRINISELKKDANTGENLTGGYIIKIDKASFPNATIYTDANSFSSKYFSTSDYTGKKIYFLYDTPDKEIITTQQKKYISDYINSFEDALAGDNFKDTEVGYAKYIDVQSFVDFFLLNELSNNVEGYRLNTRITKDKGGKLTMGPIRGFSLAFGNANYCGGDETNVWAYKFNERCFDDFWQVPFWWGRLLEDPAFVSKVKTRWFELRASSLSNYRILDKIDNYHDVLVKSGGIQDNFEKWPVLGLYVWPNSFEGETYDQEIDFMKDWIDDRLSWLDEAISNL